MLRQTRIALWRLLALVSLALGLIGVALPLVPTVPFLLLSAWAAGRGWPRLEAWLLAHPKLGPPIRRWRERGTVPRAAKVLATLAMLVTLVAMASSAMPIAAQAGVAVFLGLVLIWLWRRPEE